MRIQIIQKLIDKIRGKEARLKKTTEVVKQYRFIHIMFNDKFGKAWVDFVNKNFDTEEHLFLCKRCFDEFPFPQGKNVVEIKSLQGLDFSNAEKIFCHSLFDSELVEYLYAHQDILKQKAYWIIWGGDLYEALRDEKNDFVRENFKGYITDVDGDKVILEKKYTANKNKKFYHAAYTFPVSQEMVNNAKDTLSQRANSNKAIVIQINNSCDKSTLEILDILSRFKDENIIIKMILSYGSLEFKEQIISKAHTMFGDKFQFIDTILSPQEYAKYVSQNDVLVYNQNRQQGLGNSFLALQFGTKLYIRSEISTYEHLSDKGCVVFDTHKIPQMNFSEFITIDKKTQENNITNSAKFFSDEYLKSLWEPIFENSLEYWQNRAKNYGKHSVYNMAHSLDELASVDKKQEQIYQSVLDKHLCDMGGGHLMALDFGCGVGRFEPMLAKLAHKVYAIDPIATLIELAPKLENVEYLLLDENEKIALPDDSVNLIFVSLALGGIVSQTQLQTAVDELKRVAKPNALFFIVENTAKLKNSNYWHYRSAEFYMDLFKPINLRLETTYDDANEEISVMCGR